MYFNDIGALALTVLTFTLGATSYASTNLSTAHIGEWEINPAIPLFLSERACGVQFGSLIEAGSTSF